MRRRCTPSYTFDDFVDDFDEKNGQGASASRHNKQIIQLCRSAESRQRHGVGMSHNVTGKKTHHINQALRKCCRCPKRVQCAFLGMATKRLEYGEVKLNNQTGLKGLVQSNMALTRFAKIGLTREDRDVTGGLCQRGTPISNQKLVLD